MHKQPDKWPDAVRESGHAAAASCFGWPIRELSIQAVKASEADRVGVCQLGIEAIPSETHEDIMRSIIYSACGTAAEFLLDIETSPAVLSSNYDRMRGSASQAFPDDRRAQQLMMKLGEEAAFEIVREHRSGIEALAAALMRLERVEGSTAERFIHGARKCCARRRPTGVGDTTVGRVTRD